MLTQQFHLWELVQQDLKHVHKDPGAKVHAALTIGRIKNGSQCSCPCGGGADGRDRSPRQPVKIVTEIYVFTNIQKKSYNLNNKLSKLQNCFLEGHHTKKKKCFTSMAQRPT